jgi:hypothetical protein
MEMTTKRKAINELHTDTRILFNVLETRLVDQKAERIGYDELSKAIGRDVQKQARGLLKTARKHIEEQYHILLEPIVGEGLKISKDYAGLLGKSTAHIRRQARGTAKRVLNGINGSEIDPEQKLEITARLSILGAIELFTKPKLPKKLMASIEREPAKQLPTAETLKLFLE